jgi:hypothetical protein
MNRCCSWGEMMETNQKANRDLTITAYLFLLYAVWKGYTTVHANIMYAVQSSTLLFNPALLIMDAVNLLYIIVSVLIFILIRKKNNKWRTIAIIFITTCIFVSAFDTPRTMISYFNHEIERPLRYWISTFLQWCFYIWMMYILTRRDIRMAFESNNDHDEVTYANKNRDD